MHRSIRPTNRPGIVRGLALLLLLVCQIGRAAVGVSEIPPSGSQGRVTVFYLTAAAARPVAHGQFVLSMAPDAAPIRGNGRLVVISHGSGGSPWVHADLARALVEAGFVVALPEHRGDNYRDMGGAGPDSWTIRPMEISQAIDAVASDRRLGTLIDATRVGVYGMSAGGHAALSLAGGRWSPASFEQHCRAHLADDFQSCVGLFMRLTGSPADHLRTAIASIVLRLHFTDDTVRIDRDARVAAIVAAVPFAADFDPRSLEQPIVPLGLITARQDRWLIPRFHGDRIVAACRTCEHLLDLPDGGHGALLSPLPRDLTGLLGDMLNDPAGYDRTSSTERIDAVTVAFFRQHLLRAPAS